MQALYMSAGTVVVLTFQGPVTFVLDPCATATALLARIPVAKPRIVLDLEAVPFIDCSGIGLLAALHVGAAERGGDLRQLNLRHRPRRLLELCGLLRVLNMYESEEDALISIVGPGCPDVYVQRTPVQLTGVRTERRLVPLPLRLPPILCSETRDKVQGCAEPEAKNAFAEMSPTLL